MHMDTNFLLKQCGLTAEQVRNSSLVKRLVSAPTHADPDYQAKLSYGCVYKRKLRARLKAQGLTVEGKRRTNRQLKNPELRGLNPRQYHTRYKQLQRAGQL